MGIDKWLGDSEKLQWLVNAVAHIGVDFGYGPFKLDDGHIEAARELNEKGRIMSVKFEDKQSMTSTDSEAIEILQRWKGELIHAEECQDLDPDEDCKPPAHVWQQLKELIANHEKENGYIDRRMDSEF